MKKDISNKITNDFQLVEGNSCLVFKGENVLKTQLNSVHYLQDFGCDLDFYILDRRYDIQTEAFKNYLVKRLIESNIQVATIKELTSQFSSDFNINLTDGQEE